MSRRNRTAQRLLKMQQNVPRYAKRVTPDKMMLDAPKDLSDPLFPEEIAAVQQILRTLPIHGGKFAPTDTNIVFQLFDEKEFEVAGLPIGGSLTKGEFWAHRILKCLGEMGWKARNILMDGRTFGQRHPETN